MSDFRLVRGFEEVWRAPVGRRKHPEDVLRVWPEGETRARLLRIVRRAPEVMVKVTGRTRDGAHLKAHLDYISRKGELELEGSDGSPLIGREEVRELGEHWSAMALSDSRRRANTPVSVSVVLSMPAHTDPFGVRDAARAFALEVFGERFDYVFALHTDEPHPHVHLTVRALGLSGERLNPKKADLDAWRQAFARQLRARGIEAEATPRRARGVTLKAERMPIRKIRERAEGKGGPLAKVERGAHKDAVSAAFQSRVSLTLWELQIARRQQRVRLIYLEQARLLQGSRDTANQVLGRELQAFVRDMPAPLTQRLVLVRAIREARRRVRLDLEPPKRDGKERSR